jgi:hypothetical protein
MLIEKARIIEILRQRGQDSRAEFVDRELPADVDTYHHAGLLETLRITAADLAASELAASNVAASELAASESGSGTQPETESA